MTRTALERAAELDAQYGRKPDLNKFPLYCTTASIKNWYDVKDMRSTGGNDVAFAMDAPPQDSTVVAALRDAGAIIFAVSIAAEIGVRSDAPEKPTKVFVGGSGSIRSSWAGHVCNPYDTERSAGPSSGGAGVSVSANLVTFAICETTGGSGREPASQNAVTSVVTTKGLLSQYGTATAQYAHHRPGILARKLEDAVLVLDAVQRPTTSTGYFDSKDIFTAQPRGLLSAQPYLPTLQAAQPKGKPLQGLRIGIVREYMVKHTPNDAAISDRVDAEIKHVLRDQLGATLVESIDPDYPDDPTIANMTYSFQRALGETLAIAAPEYLLQKLSDELGGDYEFAVPGQNINSLDYRKQLAAGSAPISPKLNMRRILSGLDDGDLDIFSLDRYLTERGDNKITSIAEYAQHSRWRAQAQAVNMRNAAQVSEQTLLAKGMDRIKMREVFRMAVLKVMYENKIDLFVHPNLTVPQWKIGVDREPTTADRRAAGPSITDLLGVPEVIIPEGFDDRVYEPQYVLSPDKTRYTLVTGNVASKMRVAMPFSINFWAGPGDEAVVFRAALAYEGRTQHRVPPGDFGGLGE